MFWFGTPWAACDSLYTEIVTQILGSALMSWFPQFLPALNPPNFLASIQCFGKESQKTAQVINFCLKNFRCCLLPFCLWDANKDKCTTKEHCWIFCIVDKCRWKWPWQLLNLPKPENLCICWLWFEMPWAFSSVWVLLLTVELTK